MIEVVVRDIVQETAEIRRVTLAALAGILPAFEAGAHVDVHLPNGMVRQYSLLNPSDDTGIYHLGVLKEKNSRGGSQWLHETLRPNDRLRISAPRNLFPVIATASRHLLFAAGIGVTPILAMARHLSASGARFEVNYSVRNKDDAAFYGDLTCLSAEHIHLLASGRNAARGVLQNALSRPSHDTHAYICGPAGYIQSVSELARQLGWPESHLHTEAFSARPLSSDSSTQAFTIHLARSRATIQVTENQSVIQALQAHGVDVPVSCEQGICGTCLTRVISGIPDHRDQYLTDDERDANDQFTPCCSRARSTELVLDL